MGKAHRGFYVLKRTISLLVVLFLIASFNFISFRAISEHSFLPPTQNPELIERLTSEYHLSDSMAEQYLWYIWNTFTLDFGISASYIKGADINDYASAHLERSLWMFAIVGVLTLLAGIMYEAIASCFRARLSRMTARLVALGFFSLPSLGLALVAMDLNVRLNSILPFHSAPYNPDLTEGSGTWDHIFYNVSHGLLPVSVCILLTFGFISLFFRRRTGEGLTLGNLWRAIVGVLGAMRADPWKVKFFFAWIVSCALLLDWFSNFHGLGTLLWNSIGSRDLPLSMAAFFIIASILALSNYAFDVLCAAIPRAAPAPGAGNERRTLVAAQDVGVARATPIDLSAMSLWSDFRRSKAGLSALIVFLAIIVVAVTAPLLATVTNPENPSNYEPAVPEASWFNPLPPSLDPSPYTGFRHLLGTDYRGIDVYSEMLYGARVPVFACIAAGIISLVLGLVSGIIGARLLAKENRPIGAFGWLANVVGDAFVAIPLCIVMTGYIINKTWDSWVISVLVTEFVFLWAGVSVAGQVRKRAIEMQTLKGAEEVPSRDILPVIIARTLSITKLCVVICPLTVFMIEFFVGTSRTGWGSMLTDALERDAIGVGAWWWYLPPIIGISLLGISAFVVVDTLERIVNKREIAAVPAPPSPEATVAGSLA